MFSAVLVHVLVHANLPILLPSPIPARRFGFGWTSFAGRSLSLATLLLFLSAPDLRALPPFDSTETWSDAGFAGWSGGAAQVVLTNTAGQLDMRFAEQGFPSPMECVARYDLPDSVRITNLSFRFLAAETAPSAVRLCMGSRHGESWYVSLKSVPVATWIQFVAPVQYSAGWTFGPRKTEALFSRDADDAAWVGVYVRRDASTRSQAFAVDDFRIQGLMIPAPVSLSGTIAYDGEQTGSVRVIAESLTDASANVAAVVPAPGVYSLSGLRPMTDYRISAYLDSNTNGNPDFWEARGEWSGNPARLAEADLTGVDFALTEPFTSDGLPHWWLRKHFNMDDPAGRAEPALAGEDSDGDGMNNYAEFRAGTDPTSSASRFVVEIDILSPVPWAVLRWNSGLRRTYSVFRSDSMEEGFSLQQTGLVGHPPVNVYEDATATNTAKRFYRVRVE